MYQNSFLETYLLNFTGCCIRKGQAKKATYKTKRVQPSQDSRLTKKNLVKLVVSEGVVTAAAGDGSTTPCSACSSSVIVKLRKCSTQFCVSLGDNKKQSKTTFSAVLAPVMRHAITHYLV